MKIDFKRLQIFDGDGTHALRTAVGRDSAGRGGTLGKCRIFFKVLRRSPGTVAVEAVQSVFDVSCITDLALFSVTDHIHSNIGLLTDHGLNRISDDLVIVVQVDFFACLLGKYEFKDLFRTGEAADMGGEDSVLTQFHRYRLIWGKC